MHPRRRTIATTSLLAAATLTLGVSTAAASTPDGAATAPAECTAMAEGTTAMTEADAMAEDTTAMSEDDTIAEADAMSEGTTAMSEDDTMAEADAMSEGTTAMVEGDAMAEDGGVVAVAGEAGLTTFAAALEAVGPRALVGSDATVTIFAPTDDAIASYVAESGVDPTTLDIEAVSALLAAHVVEGGLTADELVAADGLCLTTIAGSELAVMFDGTSVVVGEATVLDAGHPASNGIVYSVDHVLHG